MSEGPELNREEVISQLEPLLAKWLPTQQRWFSSGETASSSISIVESDVLVSGTTTLLWTIVRVDDGALYQVPVGLALQEDVSSLLFGLDALVIGHVDVNGVEYLAYDGLIDGSLTRPLFAQITNGEITAKSVRPMGAEQSNTSLVFDSRYVLKVFRRLYEGNNPDLEVTRKLTEVEFPNIAPVVATWQRGVYDLAVCQPYLWDGTEGWKLALGSARDFFGPDTQGSTSTVGAPNVRLDISDPADAGGDFANEARRLGKVTGELHIALAENFDTQPFDPQKLAASLEFSMSDMPMEYLSALQTLIGEVRAVSAGEAGLAIRVHGDYHLGQVLRSVNGWFIFDFEGEPARPLTERTLPASPLKDVSGMLRSFHYAAATAVHERMAAERDGLFESSEAWEQRNRDAFKEGYLSVHDIAPLLPFTQDVLSTLLRAFEVEKAIYELAYERAHRPNWISIPQAALDRLLTSA